MSEQEKQEAALLAKALDCEAWSADTFSEYFKKAHEEALTCHPHEASYDRRDLLAKLRLVYYFIT